MFCLRATIRHDTRSEVTTKRHPEIQWSEHCQASQQLSRGTGMGPSKELAADSAPVSTSGTSPEVSSSLL